MTHKLSVYLLFSVLFASSCKQALPKEEESIIDEKRIANTFRKALNKVILDHFYVVLDSTTFAQLITSDYITRQYANLDEGIPNFKPIDTTSRAAYLRGKKQYIEILGPKNSFNEPVGKSGIGFALSEKKGFSLTNAPELLEQDTKFLKSADTVSFSFNNSNSIWYKAFYTYGMATNLNTWYSYYDPKFLEHLHKEKFTEYSQEQFLKTAYHPNKLFNEITGIEIHCNRADHYRIARELQLLGCPIAQKDKEDLLYIVDDLNLSIRLDENLSKSKITIISGTLNKKDNRTLKFKNLTINNTDYRTVWHFN